jgi:hypothetical protein
MHYLQGNLSDAGTGIAAVPGVPLTQQPGMAGFRPIGRDNSPERTRMVTEAARLFAATLEGRVDPFLFRQAMQPTHELYVHHLMEAYPGMFPQRANRLGLRETMSQTDYQALFLDVIDRLYYGYYNDFPIVNMPLVKKHTLRDFRFVSRYLLDGMVSPFTSMNPAAPPPQTAMSGPVPQKNASYPGTNTGPIQYQPLLWQSMAAVNWAAILGDDLGIFQDLPKRLGIQANRGIHQYITGLFFQASGLNTNLFAANYNNLITSTYGASSNNPPLSQQGLQDAWNVLASMKDSSGNPIIVTGTPYLVYGPANHATAQTLKSATRNWVSVNGGNQNAQGFPTQLVEAANWAMQNMELIEDPYMPLVMSSASGNIKQTAWAIVLDPNAQERPCVELGMLAGHETPQLYQKAPNTMRFGGGVEPMMGDFYSMDQEMKIVSGFAGTQIDGRTVVGSTGAGV